MFCPLAKLDLKVDLCPASGCMYTATGGGCAYERLTADEVTPQDIAEVKSIKLYKAKTLITEAKASVEIGVIAMRYADYVSESYPNLHQTTKGADAQTVNEGKDTAKSVLTNLFGLSEYQQEKFLCSTRYETWANRHSIKVKFPLLWESLQRAGSTYCV